MHGVGGNDITGKRLLSDCAGSLYKRYVSMWEGSTTVVYSFTLWFGEIPWFEQTKGEIRRCDWSNNAFFVCAQCELSGYGFLFSQSQRRIFPFCSNHGISPDDNVNYLDSGWPLPLKHKPYSPEKRSRTVGGPGFRVQG